MASEHYDGHPIQAGSTTGLLGRFSEFQNVGYVECLVVARYFVDDPGNTMKLDVEYDLRRLDTGMPLTNVRVLQGAFGLQNGNETVLHPASKGVRDNVQFSKRTKAMDTDGDRVVVGFIGGALAQAVIVGALPHGDVAYGAKAADGERRFLVHNGTTAQIKADGSFELARAGAVVNVDKDGNVAIKSGKVRIGSDPSDTSPAAREGDEIRVDLQVLVNALTPFFVSTNAPLPPPPAPPGVFVPGEIATGSSSVEITKG